MKRKYWIPLLIFLLIFPLNLAAFLGVKLPPSVQWDAKNVKVWDTPSSDISAKIVPGGGVKVYIRNISAGQSRVNYMLYSENLEKEGAWVITDKYFNLETFHPIDVQFDYAYDSRDIVYKQGQQVLTDNVIDKVRLLLYKQIPQETDFAKLGVKPFLNYYWEKFRLTYIGKITVANETQNYFIEIVWQDLNFTGGEVYPLDIDIVQTNAKVINGAIYTTISRTDITDRAIKIWRLKFPEGEKEEMTFTLPDISSMGLSGISVIQLGIAKQGYYFLVNVYNSEKNEISNYVISQDSKVLVKQTWKEDVRFAGAGEFVNVPSILDHPFFPLEKRLFKEPWENITVGYLLVGSKPVEITFDKDRTEVNVTESPKITYIGVGNNTVYYLMHYQNRVELMTITFAIRSRTISQELLTALTIFTDIALIALIVRYLVRRKETNIQLYPVDK